MSSTQFVLEFAVIAGSFRQEFDSTTQVRVRVRPAIILTGLLFNYMNQRGDKQSRSSLSWFHFSLFLCL